MMTDVGANSSILHRRHGRRREGPSRGRPTVGRTGLAVRLVGAVPIAGRAHSSRPHRRARAVRREAKRREARALAVRVRSGTSIGIGGGPPGASAPSSITAIKVTIDRRGAKPPVPGPPRLA
jgi:hypothetical protein